MSPLPHNRPVCIDDRMIGIAGTGVTAYAATLRAMLPLLTERPMLLGAADPDALPRGCLLRLVAAARPGARRARDAGGGGGEHRLLARDVFREAQVHFDLYGRLLAVRPSMTGGIMHWTYPVPLRMAGWINLYTVHDAIPLVHPELTPIDPRRHRRLLKRIVATAEGIVTVSEAARDEIVAALGCPAASIAIAGQAIVAAPVPHAALPDGLESGRYLLVCGSIEPRKNVARILDAYQASGVALPLVFVGPDGWRAAELVAQIAAVAGAHRLPWQSRASLDALIANARALLMPSLAEGFGLPVAEAMAHGVPVVTSQRGALAETAGGAALLVDPLDVEDMARAIRRLTVDDTLHAHLAAAGRRRAAAFAPAIVAPRLARIYRDVVASARRDAYPRSSHRAEDPF